MRTDILWFALPFARRKPDAASGTSTNGELLYAIGDIHGRSDLLEMLVGLIDRDARALGQQATLIFLGDYVDRGPRSNQVLDLLLHFEQNLKCRMLLGNHEHSLLSFLDDSKVGPFWALFGGAATMQSYGVRSPLSGDLEEWEQARLAFLEAFPTPHRDFLGRLELFVEIGDYFFVHAGVKPKVPLAAQKLEDLIWIRDAFLEASQPANKVVVHGHSPTATPFSGTWRIGVDTGAYATGVLTAVRLYDDQRYFIQTTPMR